jgi:UDPglucose 6-dehydrogenase
MDRIGIIGFGFVGKAVYYGFRDTYSPILIHDINPNAFDCTLNDPEFIQPEKLSIRQVVDNSDIVFVCVPTPTDLNTGKIDTSIVESVIDEIGNPDHCPIIVVKSTVIPGTCKILAQKYSHLVFNPEFLTEANYINDFLNQQYVILGGSSWDCEFVANLYRERFGIRSFITDWASAEMMKYVANCMLAVKVGLCNEFHNICNAAGIDYNVVMEMMLLDGRLGNTHLQVPGPDGQKGFGGKCFPKDIMALIGFAKSVGVDPNIMEATWADNLKNRKEFDWLKIPGAIIEKKE